MSNPSPLDSALLVLARLSAGPTENLSAALRGTCELASEALNVDRVGVWFFVERRAALRCANLYERKDGTHSMGLTIRVADFPAYFAALEARRAVPAGQAHPSPVTDQLTAAYLAPLGITALLDAGIFQGGELTGVVCHEHTGPPREWTAEEHAFAAAVADHVSLKLTGTEVQELKAALRTRDEEIADLERTEGAARLAAGAAHDFRNILTVIQLAAKEVATAPDLPEETKEFLAMLLEAADRGATLARDMSAFGRSTPDAPQVVRPGKVVGRLLPTMKAAAGASHPITLQQTGSDAAVFVDPDGLERVVLNLVMNARDAMPGGGPIAVSVGPTDGHVRLAVTDTGAEIPDGERDRLFEPFAGTAVQGHGAGLGLATVKRIVDRAGGRVELATADGKGTTVAVYFPRVAG